MSQSTKVELENCDLSDNETSDTKSESIGLPPTPSVAVKNEKTAGRLTFSISRLLECHPPGDGGGRRDDNKDNHNKLVEQEEDENDDDKSSISSSIDCDSPVSAYSHYRAEHTKENQAAAATAAAYLQSAIEAGHLGLGHDAATNPASHTSSPTNSVIRVPAHRPPPSSALSAAYGVGYPWINQPPGSFIKEGLAGKFVPSVNALPTIQWNPFGTKCVSCACLASIWLDPLMSRLARPGGRSVSAVCQRCNLNKDTQCNVR